MVQTVFFYDLRFSVKPIIGRIAIRSKKRISGFAGRSQLDSRSYGKRYHQVSHFAHG